MSDSPVSVLRETAARYPGLTAIRRGSSIVSYAELSAAVDRVTAHLRQAGAGPGGLVATLLPNSVEFVATYYAAQLAGSAIVPFSPTLRRPMLEQRLSECRPAVLMLPAQAPEWARGAGAATGASLLTMDEDIFSRTRPGEQALEIPDTPPDAVATLSYTSAGSQGAATAELTRSNLAVAASTLARAVLHLTPGDVLLSTFPTLSTLGQTCGINTTVAAGACLTIPPRFDPDEILRVIVDQRVTVLAIFPALLPGLLREAQRCEADVSSLRTILGAGGATVTHRLREPLEATFGCEILQCYGPTESAALACATLTGDDHRPGSVGKAVDGVEVRVNGGSGREARPGISGELLVRGPHTMPGYRGDAEATRLALRDGWLHTGTEARMDPGGHVYLLDGGWIGRARGPRVGRPGPLRRAWRSLRGRGRPDEADRSDNSPVITGKD